jgi:hypothetical protein
MSGQATKADPSISSVDAGAVNDVSLDLAKAHSPIIFSLEESSNVIAIMLWQCSNH